LQRPHDGARSPVERLARQNTGYSSPMDRSPRRVVDDERLTGLWLRHAASDYLFSAPVWLADQSFSIAQMERRTTAGALATAGRPSRRTIHWLLFDRSGQRDSGTLDLPAVAFWQALAHVGRRLREGGFGRAKEKVSIALGSARTCMSRQTGELAELSGVPGASAVGVAQLIAGDVVVATERQPTEKSRHQLHVRYHPSLHHDRRAKTLPAGYRRACSAPCSAAGQWC